MSLPDFTPTLANCEDEPIHTPGSIAPHGALLAFERGLLVYWSANAPQRLSVSCRTGARPEDLFGPTSICEAAVELIDEVAQFPESPVATEVTIDGAEVDLVVHRQGSYDIMEFETRIAPDDRVKRAYGRSFERMKRAESIKQLLAMATTDVRAWTGFDRVMAYVFRHDNSGDVVAESRAEGVDSYLGMRFPESDIPTQARRLYVVNTLRLIPDTRAAPVPIMAAPGAAPLDMSNASLRSVSPIHIEYLTNMGVDASMSISIVVEGRLWGLIACHHHAPLLVPRDTRLTCDMLAHALGANVQALEAKAHSERMAEGTSLLAALAADFGASSDTIDVLWRNHVALMRMFRADGVLLTQQSKLLQSGNIPTETAHAIVAHLSSRSEPIVTCSQRGDWPERLQPALGSWVGALSIFYDPLTGARIVALRREQVDVVRWAGKPAKHVTQGPEGPRLSPRGSFAEWRETVRGQGLPWVDISLRLARHLQVDLQRVVMAQNAEMDEMRRNLIAMLGHDLRDPIHAIKMMAGVLQAKDGASPIGKRLDSTSGRMKRLVDQVLDFSRVESGQLLVVRKEGVDLSALVEDVVQESRIGHPGVDIVSVLHRGVIVEGDVGRLGQALGNLISNARHHGEVGKPINVVLHAHGLQAFLDVRNFAAPIPAGLVRDLMVPYKKRDASGLRNRTGLGLGLYLSARIAAEHGGALSYRYEAGEVVFTLMLKLFDSIESIPE